jgi:hypothetical protein
MSVLRIAHRVCMEWLWKHCLLPFTILGKRRLYTSATFLAASRPTGGLFKGPGGGSAASGVAAPETRTGDQGGEEGTVMGRTKKRDRRQEGGIACFRAVSKRRAHAMADCVLGPSELVGQHRTRPPTGGGWLVTRA